MEPEIFMRLGCEINKHCVNNSENVGLRRFKSLFGVTPLICSIIWNKIRPNIKNGCSPKHLLWTLMFLRNYNTEETNRAILNVDEKTIRKYVWDIIDYISSLRVVSYITHENSLGKLYYYVFHFLRSTGVREKMVSNRM